MFCSKCGKEIEDDAKFCQYCGHEIGTLKINNKIIIAIICLIFILITGFVVLYTQKNNNETTITIKNGKSLINNPYNFDSNFIGSKVLVKIKSPNVFKPVNKRVMSALHYKFDNSLYNNHHADATVVQVANDKFMIYIPNEFDKKEIEKILNNKPMLEFKKHPQNNETLWEATGISGTDLKNAFANKDEYSNQWVVILNFNNKGKIKFATLTSELVNKPLGIFMDNELQSAPVIREPITGGTAQISGGAEGFTYEEASQMADVLNADAACFKVKIEEIN